VTFPGHLIRRCTLLFDGCRDGGRNVVELVDDGANRRDRVDRSLGIRLNRRDLLADVLGCLGRLLGQFLHLNWQRQQIPCPLRRLAQLDCRV